MLNEQHDNVHVNPADEETPANVEETAAAAEEIETAENPETKPETATDVTPVLGEQTVAENEADQSEVDAKENTTNIVKPVEKKRFKDSDDDDDEEDEDHTPKDTKPRINPIAEYDPYEQGEYTEEEQNAMVSLYEESLADIAEDKIITGRVLQINEKEVIVDVGFKSEGMIPAEEFSDGEEVKIGDEIEVYLEKFENQEGLVVLSKKKADFLRVWDKIKNAFDSGEKVKGKLVRKIKGGVVVDLMGVDAFLPGSQIDVRQVPDLDTLIGHLMEFKIIKLNKRRRNIVVSRRVVLEQEREVRKHELIKELEEGQVRDGIVKNITDFGAFVDLGGIDGLLHITDMSWGRVSHPSELVKLGETIKVKILEFDRDRERISLGMKQLTPYPWEGVDDKYPVGSRVEGKVVSITDYGIFVELEKGVEGLIHISEMSWTRQIKHPSKIVALGDVVEAIVLKVDKEEEKISLGMKQTEDNPWDTLDERYPIGARVNGIVRNLTTFGVFIELEEGIDGLVHISDMSWTKRVRHPSEIVKKGDEVEVVILNIDKENHRISLGLKQIEEDPWERIAEKHPVNSDTSGEVVRLLDRGLIVELPDDVEGFVPFSHLGRDDIAKPSDAFNEGDELKLKVIEIDPENRRIVLSVKEFFTSKEKEEQEAKRRESEEAQSSGPSGGGTLADVAPDALKQAATEKEAPAEAEPAPLDNPEAEKETEETPAAENAADTFSEPEETEEADAAQDSDDEADDEKKDE